jgi:hypothetical protein
MCVPIPFAAFYLCEAWFTAVADFEKQISTRSKELKKKCKIFCKVNNNPQEAWKLNAASSVIPFRSLHIFKFEMFVLVWKKTFIL